MSQAETPSRSRWWIARSLILVVVLGIGLLAGDWLDLFFNQKPDLPEPREVNLGAPGTYVALGDSFSAGEGLSPFESGTEDTDRGGDRCHRSQEFAYPLALEFTHETTVQFRACSGAVVDNVFGSVQEHDGVPNRQGKQVETGVGGENVRLVTITMGGNDLDFAKVLNFCFEEPHCADQKYKGEESLDRWINLRIEEVGSSLAALYADLRESFSKARVLVLGYPPLFPEFAPPLSKPHNAVCQVLFSKWKAEERQAIRDWGLALNGAIEVGAGGAGVEYVDVSSHFAGHEPCGTAGEWVRFVGLSLDSAIRDGSFHPLRDGQAMMARIVSCHIEVMEPGTTTPSLTQRYAMTGCVARETRFVAEPPPIEQAVSAGA